ncbi:hypothetical protein [Limosilactobacillus vaginalis]|nr:hypothetical protein [Limosilactobacillus vaginalis]MCZ3757047.1 hypothetical protein [Limosilactobacillus vaginalis]
MAMNQEKIHYYIPFSSKNEDLRMFNYWALQVFEIMDNVTHKPITDDINIFVSPNFGCPESWSNVSPIRINLAMDSLLYWAQEVYQLAHEYCHVLISSPYNPQTRDEWFEEAICECASRYVLIKINENELAKKLYPGEFVNYEESMSNRTTYTFDLKSLVSENSETLIKLRTNHEWREAERYLADQIFPIIAESDYFWQSIPDLARFKNDNTFMENLNEWYKVSPESAKPQVAKIIKLFNDN